MQELIKIQKELQVPKNQYNSFGKYRYRSCEDILEWLKPLLAEAKCTLTITDDVVLIGDRYYIKATATIYNQEKEWVTVSAFARESLDKKGMDDSQITGTASSYARKYALNWLFLIDDSKDVDEEEKKKKSWVETSYIKKVREFVAKRIPQWLTPEQAKIEANEFVSKIIEAYFSFDGLTEEKAKDVYFKLLK